MSLIEAPEYSIVGQNELSFIS